MRTVEPKPGDAAHVFSYSKPLLPTQPACRSGFTRTFQHQDWVDGESVVQAEQSTGEDGFNLRFHRIEQDLDSLAVDVTRAYTCLAELRASVAVLLEEVRTELNRINVQVFLCCGGDEPPIEIHHIEPHIDIHQDPTRPIVPASEPFYVPAGAPRSET